MKIYLLLLFTLLACADSDPMDPIDLFSVDELQGEYTLSVLVTSIIEDVGGPDERFIPVEQTQVLSFPFVTGYMSITADTMSFHVNTTLPGGVATDLIVIDFEASIVIVPPPRGNPGEFKMHATYHTEWGRGAFSRTITRDGSILGMGYSQAGHPAQYTLYWHKQ